MENHYIINMSTCAVKWFSFDIMLQANENQDMSIKGLIVCFVKLPPFISAVSHMSV